MQIRDGIIEAIGHTPLIKLKRASEATGCTILGKAEFMNPGGSVKDRAGRQMILEAEKRGELRPGGLVVEATAGNTGIGLALVANARGYRTLIVIPRDAKPGKEGHAPPVRRRACRSAGGALLQPEQLSACRAAARRAAQEN
jgi:cysteine synthase A